jgi:Cu(I)/Ag(I) efflux system membrane protein CusA/SilA
MLKSENARLNSWVFVDISGVDLGSYVNKARAAVLEKVELPPGYSIAWSGQYEYLTRAQQTLRQVIPLTLIIIFMLLYLALKDTGAALLVMLSLPFALVGGFWLLLLLDFNLSVAVTIGFIALAGVAAEFGVVMLIYLDNALAARRRQGHALSDDALRDAIMEGAVLRVRPKAMTVAVIIGGLLPIMLSEGTGSEVMQRIAAPMIGGMVTAPLLSMFVIPAVYYLRKRRAIDTP